jgi:addiction module HigA family antidote
MLMKRPPHPGRIVRQECIEPLGLTVTEAAARLDVTRQNLNNLLNGKSGISPEMAIRLSKAFGSRAEVWLGLQMEYDLAEAEKTAGKIKVTRVTPKKGELERLRVRHDY